MTTKAVDVAPPGSIVRGRDEAVPAHGVHDKTRTLKAVILGAIVLVAVLALVPRVIQKAL